MRTTLNIDDDVLAAAKGLAALQRKSVGEIISALVRTELELKVPNAETLAAMTEADEIARMHRARFA